MPHRFNIGHRKFGLIHRVFWRHFHRMTALAWGIWDTNFSYDTELQLKSGNEAYQKDGTLLNIRKDTKSEILDKLAETIYTYTAYPSREEYDIVAQSLINKHPCLGEPVSSKAWYCWKFILKFKMGNYRNKLCMVGCSELQVNSCSSAPKQKLKRAKKAEVNFLPDFPEGRTEDPGRREIADYCRDKEESRYEEMMVSTFSLWRKQIVEEEPPVSEVKIKWPALFAEQQVSVFNQGYRLIICSFNFGLGWFPLN